jgi:hypothetical protein
MTTTTEPEWDDEGRKTVLALAVYDESLCPLCGQPSHICQDPANQFKWHAPEPVRCHATTALLAKQKGYTEETNPQVQALMFGVRLNEGGD